MKRLLIGDTVKEGKGKVQLWGWVHRQRNSNEMAFIVLRDASGIIQCVIKKADVDKESWEAATKANVESSMEIFGELKKDERAPTGFEIVAEKVRFIYKGDAFPIAKDFSPEYLLDVRHRCLFDERAADRPLHRREHRRIVPELDLRFGGVHVHIYICW